MYTLCGKNVGENCERAGDDKSIWSIIALFSFGLMKVN